MYHQYTEILYFPYFQIMALAQLFHFNLHSLNHCIAPLQDVQYPKSITTIVVWHINYYGVPS